MTLADDLFPKIYVQAKTDIGRRREHNEDAVICVADKGKIPFIAVADGVGGSSQGEVASQMTLELLQEYIEKCEDPSKLSSYLVSIIEEINKQIVDQAHKDGVSSMGCTLTGVLFIADTAIVFNVGDSRVYMLRDGDVEQVTEDHSLVNQMVKSGGMTEEEAEEKVNSNIITRMVGMEKWEDVDLFSKKIKAEDVFLACSDGLTKHVKDKEICELIQDVPIEDVPDLLIQKANERGGTDNISVALGEVEDIPDIKSYEQLSREDFSDSDQSFDIIGFAVGLFLAIVVFAAIVFIYFSLNNIQSIFQNLSVMLKNITP